MSPEIAERLARVFPMAVGQKSAVADVAPVADVARYARKPPELQPLQPLHIECSEAGKKTGDAVAAHVASPIAPDDDAIEERAALAADCAPSCYLDSWARLNHQKPANVSEAEWRLALDDGGRFLDAWGSEAAETEWIPGELFDVSAGLVWKLAGACVEALGPDHARLSDGRIVRRSEMKGGA